MPSLTTCALACLTRAMTASAICVYEPGRSGLVVIDERSNHTVEEAETIWSSSKAVGAGAPHEVSSCWAYASAIRATLT